jgi:serine/threonine protein kinase
MLDWTPPAEFDGYRLIRLLGSGAMGEVHLALDTLLDRHVAIKFILQTEEDPNARARFMVEARAIARLQHPNVVAVYRVGEVQGWPYLVYEFVRGVGLDELPAPVPWEQALSIGMGLARGLATAHQRGVLHRDIKPANVIGLPPIS